jgi:predicted nucleic acid-binding protein
MRKTTEIVINASPTVALVAAMGDLRVLQIYERVWVPLEVCDEILVGGAARFAATEFSVADWLHKVDRRVALSPLLANALDVGEAAVIQLALDRQVKTVCIDEQAGRRMARLHGLDVTGSIGILLRAKEEGFMFSMRIALQRMRAQGIWISASVMDFAVAQAGEA